jgi:antitoxin (DNA-binding transcriptional repressor) of toxin-antitoxin stability system
MSITMGIREVTRHTSQTLHRAADGETVIVTEHDRPIAMIVPLPETGNELVDALIREGKLTPSSNPGGIPALLAINALEASDERDTAEILAEMREERL